MHNKVQTVLIKIKHMVIIQINLIYNQVNIKLCNNYF